MRNASDQTPTVTVHTSPLALDETGALVQLPEGGAGWRIRRHTGGRPKLQLDGNRQPMQFPLSYTLNDAEDILAPGTYRLDLIDTKGTPLEFTAQIHVGGALRNADAAESTTRDEPENDNLHARLPSTASDVRLVLEANVRSTQLAFQHNERNLTASLRMADALREGVQALAEAQAEFLKSLASSRGFFRNSSGFVLPPASREERHDDDDGDEDEELPLPNKQDRLVELGLAVAGIVNTALERFGGGTASAGAVPAKAAPGFNLASLFDWRRAAPQPAALESPRNEVTDVVTFLKSLPPAVQLKLATVRARLTAEEGERMLRLVGAMAPQDLSVIVAELANKPVDEIVDLFRAQLDRLAVE